MQNNTKTKFQVRARVFPAFPEFAKGVKLYEIQQGILALFHDKWILSEAL